MNNEQEYVVKNQTSFELDHIFECGQCFRWNKQPDGSYTGVFGNNVLNVKKENKGIVFQGVCNEEIEVICKKYFDLDTDYEKIKRYLSKKDTYLEKSIEYGNGIRILKQDLWETIISFIISANNNIPRIKGIIEKLSKKYGTKIEYKGMEFYTFPRPEQLKNATIEDFRKLGLGFRDKRLYETTKMILENKIDLEELEKESDVKILKNKLIELSGVGPKVADCIMLFALKKYEVFPIDVWVRRVMNELYLKNPNEEKVNKKEIEKIAEEKFGNLAGIAQQYLFFYRKNIKNS